METTKLLNIIRLPQNVIKLSNMADQQTVLPIIFILGKGVIATSLLHNMDDQNTNPMTL